jgi:PEP-CTERM motif
MRRTLLSTTALAGLVAAAAAVLGPLPAEAGTIHGHTSSVTSTQVATTGADFTGAVLDFPEFNSNSGNLDSVVVVENLAGKYQGSASITVGGARSTTVTAATALTLSSGPSVLNGSGLTFSSAGRFSIGTSSTPVSLPPANTAPSATYTSSLGDWENPGGGTGSVTIDSSTSATTPPSVGLSVVPTLTFSMDITYNYHTTTSGSSSPAPEPASGLMLGAGLIALGAKRRRRRKP